MELRHLRYFVVVAEELHFSRAAARLHMAQPPLSQQIQQLEAELGIKLFQRRTKRQVQLTEAGQVFLQAAYQILADVEQAVQAARRAGPGQTGHLVVGFTSSVTYDVLPLILQQFRSQFPDVELVLRELTTNQQVQALHKEQIQVGFGYSPFEDERLNSECVMRVSLMVALPEAHPLANQTAVSVRSLVNESFILFPRQLGSGLYDQIIRVCQQADFMPRVMQEAIQMQTIIGLVSAGMGIALVPSSLENLQRTGIVYRALQEPTPPVEMAVVWRREGMSPVLQEFLSIVRLVAQQTT